MSENSSAGTGQGEKTRPKKREERQRQHTRSRSAATESPSARTGEATASSMAGGPRFSLLSFSGPVDTASNLPGRVRFRTKAVIGSKAARGLLVENLQKIKGVKSVEVDLISGSILVRYDPEAITPEILFAAIIKLLDLESEFLSTPQPVLARELREVAGSLNRTVYELTGGVTDLHTLFLIGLGVFGIYLFRRDGARAFPGGFTLLWWMYSSMLRNT